MRLESTIDDCWGGRGVGMLPWPPWSAPDVADSPAPLDERRRSAVLAATEQARGPSGHGVTAHAGGTGGISICVFASGRIVLALAGRFDTVGRDRLWTLVPTLQRHAQHELVVDMSGLQACDRGLARVIARLRISHLVRGAHVELRDPPESVLRELGQLTERIDTTFPARFTEADR